jgi:hypothetical protein
MNLNYVAAGLKRDAFGAPQEVGQIVHEAGFGDLDSEHCRSGERHSRESYRRLGRQAIPMAGASLRASTRLVLSVVCRRSTDGVATDELGLTRYRIE